MADLKPIPIPASERWREFRYRTMPVLIFTLGVLCVASLWRSTIMAPTLVGQVEASMAEVRSPNAGILTNLWVSQFQRVKQGDPVAEVIATDFRTYEAEMARLRGSSDITQVELSAEMNRGKIAFDYQSIRTDYFKYRVEKAEAAVQLAQAEVDVKRNQEMLNKQLVSPAMFETVVKTRDVLKVRNEELDLLLKDLAARLDAAKDIAENLPKGGEGAPINQILKQVDQEKSRWATLKVEPLVLRAPISGTVSMVHRRTGENVMAGEAIVTITSETGDKVIAYLRQPLPFEPKQGMPVQVRLRTVRREQADSKISQVGAQMQPIIPALGRPGMKDEIGLPIAVGLPPALKPRPGELVDLTVDVSGK